jgi:hypothetical protein
MDALEKAKESADRSLAGYEQGLIQTYTYHTNQAIAHALIALVERLDRVTNVSGADPYIGWLRVDDGRP